MMGEAKAWWLGRSRREQVLLAILGGVAAIALLLVAVVKPLQAARGAALADIRTYQTLAARLRAAGPLAADTPVMRSGTPDAILAATAADAGIGAIVATPAGAGMAVTIADAPYEGVLRWIAATEATSTLRLRTLSLRAGRAAGLVAVSAEFS